MGLFKPLWERSMNFERVEKKIAKISDVDTLVNVANTALNSDIRALAYVKLLSIAAENNDQNMLCNLILTPPLYAETRKVGVPDADIEAVKKLTDQALITRIAKNGRYFVRKEAIKKLTDRSLLLDIAKNDEIELSMIAFGRLNNAGDYKDLISNSKHDAIKVAAALKSDEPTDQGIYLDFLLNHESFYGLAAQIFERITDKDSIRKIMDSAKNNSARHAACIKLYSEHDIDGCTCRRCGFETHDWIDGEEIWAYEEEKDDGEQIWVGYDKVAKSHVEGYQQKCSRCGEKGENRYI